MDEWLNKMFNIHKCNIIHRGFLGYPKNEIKTYVRKEIKSGTEKITY